MTNKPTIVLVHGAWADGSCWNKVIPRLMEEGYNVVATQHALHSVPDDVETVRRVAEMQDGPAILVGHSYGGAVITEAAHLCPNVVALVYIAAFAPDEGESLASLAAAGAPPPGAAAIRPDKYGVLWLDKELFADNFCQDVEKKEAAVMCATQQPITVRCFEDKITNAGWKNLPCWYQVSSNDRMIPPTAEQFIAQRMNAQVISLAASHTPMVSHPDEIAEFILKAAVEAASAVPQPVMN